MILKNLVKATGILGILLGLVSVSWADMLCLQTRESSGQYNCYEGQNSYAVFVYVDSKRGGLQSLETVGEFIISSNDSHKVSTGDYRFATLNGVGTGYHSRGDAMKGSVSLQGLGSLELISGIFSVVQFY